LRFLLLVLIGAASAAEIPLAERRSGYEFMSPQTRALQDDEVTGPAVLPLLDGEGLWKRDCAGCHGDAAKSMRGVAVRYPAVDALTGAPQNLAQRINACVTTKMKKPALAHESRELLELTAYVGRQSRGLPISDVSNSQTKPFIDAGRATYFRRQGQLNFSCSQCHDDNWDRKLAGTPITQGQATGYPVYRLEWQNLGSLERRIRNCMTGVRAEPYPFGAREMVELEMYLMWRARGMKLETPAVRP
jgi:sulfur-oxidizing protein SoxA